MQSVIPKALALGVLGYLGAGYWMRKHPSAMPYAQRFFTELPHPVITRGRLRQILEPQAGETLLEVGPGTGYYTLSLGEWVSPGVVDILDVRQEFLDHVMRRITESGLRNVHPTRGDAQSLPFEDRRFDGAIAIAVLGEIPDQGAALQDLRRVLRRGGRLVVVPSHVRQLGQASCGGLVAEGAVSSGEVVMGEPAG